MDMIDDVRGDGSTLSRFLATGADSLREIYCSCASLSYDYFMAQSTPVKFPLMTDLYLLSSRDTPTPADAVAACFPNVRYLEYDSLSIDLRPLSSPADHLLWPNLKTVNGILLLSCTALSEHYHENRPTAANLEIRGWSPSQHITHLFEALKNRPVQKLLLRMRKGCNYEGLGFCTKEDDFEKHFDAFKLLFELSQQHTPHLRSLYYQFYHMPNTAMRVINAVRILLCFPDCLHCRSNETSEPGAGRTNSSAGSLAQSARTQDYV